VEGLLDDAIVDAAGMLEKHLRSMIGWAWESAGRNVILAVPMKAWLLRLSPIVRYGESIVHENLNVTNLFKKITDGNLSKEAAAEALRKIEFPQLDATRVRDILTATTAADGMDAMTRIKTVSQSNKNDLLNLLTGGLPAGSDGASLKDYLAPKIDDMVGGIRYKAMRIARTESIRIAETMQRESWKDIQDLMIGVRTFTANDSKVREEHQHWHDKLFYRTSDGNYVAADGEPLPDLPAGPNCRCWSTPEFSDDLTDGLPAVDYGSGYAASLQRFQMSGM
jgi:hypothetical protein